ncbi:uncharacterized protein EV420DRAFT_926077 [Desarmillaria tabescens]|uniref:F-box domain-containing protein n=1 Tax=Armillaria tabescens TaxID=1929756 RepID=A0AA39NFV5_ARMTA|nr:uncharacterized protein EV420DRAFT_926077 [Desarmillaria tabescens]KAK0464881.1 hypothetical protein EV420DRAFT_926077 [Desarmillaria tabescens]
MGSRATDVRDSEVPCLYCSSSHSTTSAHRYSLSCIYHSFSLQIPSPDSCSHHPENMASVSKINQLPDELLASIFATGLRGLSSDKHKVLLALICSICRHWRNVAIGASELWTTIHISLERHLPAAQAFLERSKGRLIHITIETLYPSDPDSSTAARRTADITAPHISRAQTLTMILPHADIYAIFSDAYRSISPPDLASLSIHITDGLWSITRLRPLFTNTNSLCHFDTQGRFINIVSSKDSLTKVELSDYSPTHADLQKLFAESPRLETLILRRFHTGATVVGTDEEDTTPFTITAPASLKSLAVSFVYHSHSNDPASCDCVLGSLSIPNLEYLEVVGTAVLDINLKAHFGERAQLRTLRIQRYAVSSADEEFFLSLKELRRLELVDIRPQSQIQYITRTSKEDRPSSSFSLFPHLSSVFFSMTGEYAQSPYQLLELAERRVEAGCPRFTLEFKKGCSEPPFFDTVVSCIQDGRICLIESDCPSGLIKPDIEEMDADGFGDQDEEGMDADDFWDQDEEEMIEWEHDWEVDYDGWDEEEEDEDDEFYDEDPLATYM